MKSDLANVKKEVKRLKRIAEEYPFVDTEGMPPTRHWATLPGNVRTCFTLKNVNGEFYYHLSVSASYGRVDDVVVTAILKMLGAPKEINEIPPTLNRNVRHFWWLKETVKR